MLPDSGPDTLKSNLALGALDDVKDVISCLHKLRIEVAHAADNGVHQPRKEAI